MGRTPKFTREQLQATALSIVDEKGLDGLSMRTLAAALGTGAMTLYNYLATREELDVLVVEAVVARATWTMPPNATWQDELLHVAKGVWDAVRAHPNVVPLVLTRRSRSAAVCHFAESLLAPLARGGLSEDALLVAFRGVTALIMGLAQGELSGPLALQAGECAQETIQRFRALPADRFPHLIDAAGAAMRSTPEAEFEAAMKIFIAGLHSMESDRTASRAREARGSAG
ncbi:MAG: TetR family transcriptional regulator [Acidovorax sp.]|nr:MAG: TetR family transcriptional regulator [Acidovorax sp.]